MVPSRLHSVALFVWALAAMATVEIAPNPLYAGIVVAAAVVLVRRQARDTTPAKSFPTLLILSAAFVLVRVVLSVLTVHGTGDAAFTLPDLALPWFLGGYTIGGTIELPVILQAVADGVAVIGVVAAFAAFNAVVSHYELIQSAPRAFYEPGLVVVVALAFVPSTLSSFRDVRVADRARTGGLRVRRGRITRWIIPVLETGMERAMALAESMDSRGFGRSSGRRAEAAAGWLSLGALLLLSASFVALVGLSNATALVLATLAVLPAVAAAVTASRSHRRSRHRPRRLAGVDLAVITGAVSVPLALALLRGLGGVNLRWQPATGSPPDFDPLVAATILLLMLPALLPTSRGLSVELSEAA